MNGKERRLQIIEELKNTEVPLSGMKLAKKMGVSRQVIVQDMALLRASNKNIISTTRGYLLYKENHDMVKRIFSVKHSDTQICDELYLIVDNGGRLLDVTIVHPVYGSITTDLLIQNRREADEFRQKLEEQKGEPLLRLTNGPHLHTVEAENEEILDGIQKLLKEEGMLMEEYHD